MIAAPLDLREFLIHSPSDFPEYEVFAFDTSIEGILDNLTKGIGLPIPPGEAEPAFKSWLFSDMDELVAREQLTDWLRSSKINDYYRIANTAASWRLLHVIRDGAYYPPSYQGHPIRVGSFSRDPQVIKKSSSRRDMFDPLSRYLDDPSFYGGSY